MSYKNLSTINTVTKTASYDILDTDEYLWYLVDASAGDVNIKLPLLANNYNKPIGIKFVKTASTNKAIVIPHATDATKLTNDDLASIYLPKVGDYILFVGCQTSGFWEVLDEKITSQIRLNTFSTYGGTDIRIVRLTNVGEVTGNMMSENHVSGYSAGAAGLEITINRTGNYSIHVTWSYSGSSSLGWSINSSQKTTSIALITAADALTVATNVSGNFANAAIKRKLTKNDVVRLHGDGSSYNAFCQVTIVYEG